MYEKFYGLGEKPFALNPDPTFLYLGTRHALGLSMLQYGLANRASIMLLTGGIGTGKTTLVRQLLQDEVGGMTVGLVSNTHESFGNLMQWVSAAFSLPLRASKAVSLERFTNFLIDEYKSGRRTLLIIDEAQNLSDKSLEELRLLNNINADKHQLLQMMLVGQPEMRDRLRKPKFEQFVQRIGADFHLGALSVQETLAYVAHRLRVAGGDQNLFEPAACRFIHYQSAGIPRLINSLCDTALIYSYSSAEPRVSADLVFELVLERIESGLFAASGEAGMVADKAQARVTAEENRQRAERECSEGDNLTLPKLPHSQRLPEVAVP